ncbi:MAG: patatin-like phospholipase family protein [Gemmatimonadales bacterium]
MRAIPLFLAALLAVPSLAAQDCRPLKTALVLSGGGARGLAHIGVLRTLDSLGARPDLVVGTSMGAIVGALYASGYTGRQIDSLVRDLPVAEVVRPFQVPSPHPWDQRLPLLYMVKGKSGFEFQTGVVDEARPNARLNVAFLRGNLLARGRFDRLPIPFLAVATDLRDRSTVVMGDGDLAQAVRASSAIPLVFPPVVRDGAILVDGGLSANIPIAEARAAGAERVIVSDVTEHLDDSLDVESPIALADQLLGFMFHQPPAELRAHDVFVRPEVQDFRSLDFSRETMAEVLRRGRRAADAVLGGASCLPRSEPTAPATLPDRLAGWSIQSGTSADSALVARILDLKAGGQLDLPKLRGRLLSLADAEAFRGAWLNPADGDEGLVFRVEPIHAPRTVGGGGIAYDNELGGQAWGGLFDRQLFGTTLEASVLASIGRYHRELFATALSHVDGGWSRLTPMLTFRLRGEDLRQFDADGETLPELSTSYARGTGGVELRLGPSWRFRLGGDVVTYGATPLRGETGVGGSLRVLRAGSSGLALDAEAIATDKFQRVLLAGSVPMLHRGWSVVPTARLGWGADLPPQWTFPLGGYGGFPGLHLGEERGTREASGSLRLGVSIKGPIELRVLLAGGRAWSPADSSRDWLGGVRLGLGADTPAGPIDLAYGVSTSGRGALYLRLGQWF